jgi:heme-degrading monooxygenase HmoA
MPMNPPPPPYYAVIFSSVRTNSNEGYDDWNDRLFDIVKNTDGYLGHESFRNEAREGVTISYWRDLEALNKWRNEPLHRQAQELGRLKWYSHYRIRVCKVERDYEFNA